MSKNTENDVIEVVEYCTMILLKFNMSNFNTL